MTREIKFRAWVENKDLFGEEAKKKWMNGFMFTGFSFKDVDAGHDEANAWCENERWEEPDWDKAILMQSTGLKDKNGKEIYEGDILKYKTVFMEVFWRENLTGFMVKYVNIWKKIAHKPQYAYKNLEWASTHGEIIGNIYENPELLTKSK